MYDVLVRGSRVVLPEAGIVEVDLGVKDGHVAAHLAPKVEVEAREVLDVA